MKKLHIACSALALTILAGGLLAPSTAEARCCPCMNGGHGGQGMQKSEITDAQRAEAQALVEAAQEKMRPLRDQTFVKKHELEALKNAANPDVQAVSKTAQELVALREQLRQEKDALGIALDKALGLPPGTHGFKGYDMKMPRHGKGHGKGHDGDHGGGRY